MRALDQSGNIRDNERRVIVARSDDAKVRLQGRERVIRNLRFSGGDPRDQRGFPGIRESDQSDVRE
jgi:hypothetical protein